MTRVELITKHPKIFDPALGESYGMNWDIPDAWIPVVDDLCSAIQQYIDTTVWYKEGGQHKPKQVRCTQMKEKFGGLRFYTIDSDETIEGMIDLATYICSKICEHCGTRENLGKTDGWISICCESCHDAGKAGSGEWKPLTLNK